MTASTQGKQVNRNIIDVRSREDKRNLSLSLSHIFIL